MRSMEEIHKILEYINSFDEKINLMEVCGTHTNAISKFGIRSALRENINLISGPGCPVCVTPDLYLDYIYDLSLKEEVIIATYGDMIRVPGSLPSLTLENAKAKGANVKMVYSSMDAVNIAEENPTKKVVFLGIGFETTAPATAIAVREAKGKGLKNFFVLSIHKLVEPVMRLLLEDETLKINGFLCPGHVAVVIGEKGFEFLEEYHCPAAIAGFEMDEVLEGIFFIIKSLKEKNFKIKNPYSKLVKHEGNRVAKDLINSTFIEVDDPWRGIGTVSKSGLKLNNEYKQFDIENTYPINVKDTNRNNGCKCGDILKGKLRPNECPLFEKVCTPENPIGPCMVSGEGSCAAYYKYSTF
ncbi:hydrogenase formation protein HypD [Candidatus Clostridium stratigraminis]|uniref:Hydrogenase formation protein HypD n=1 Tax=Candidatus Clostridium stratigraminis TaxID=3381661 RepID=A0ABW8T3Q9_9CLOT